MHSACRAYCATCGLSTGAQAKFQPVLATAFPERMTHIPHTWHSQPYPALGHVQDGARGAARCTVHLALCHLAGCCRLRALSRACRRQHSSNGNPPPPPPPRYQTVACWRSAMSSSSSSGFVIHMYMLHLEYQGRIAVHLHEWRHVHSPPADRPLSSPSGRCGTIDVGGQ